jgi:putative methionine-R-sulfoxide reductase with GAF domain
VTDQDNQDKKPVLDQQTFEKLLEAAYVLQEHNRKMRKLEESLEAQSEMRRQQELAEQSPPPANPPQETPQSAGDYTLTLSQIVEVQHQIQMHQLGLDETMAVVAERVTRITNSSGAAIGILEGKIMRYRAGSGKPALPVGTASPLDSAICVASVRTGKVIRSENINAEFLFDPEPCRRRGILSLLSVPIYHEGDIVGALELYFDRIHGFAEQDIHTCQLMAGLVTEAIGRDTELQWKNSMEAERSTTLAAMEKLKPNVKGVGEDVSPSAATRKGQADFESEFPCETCGGSLLTEEQFCGNCGAPRANGNEPGNGQREVSWHSQSSRERLAATPSNADVAEANETHWASNRGERNDTSYQKTGTYGPEHEPFLPPDAELQEDSSSDGLITGDSDDEAMAVPSNHRQSIAREESTALVVQQRENVVWSSAAQARDFLESLSGKRHDGALARYWRSRRGDFYLGLAIILVIVVIRWGIWSNGSTGTSGVATTIAGTHRKRFDPNANLSTFDKFLIGMGLAEAPDPPEYKGNPNIQVWVDLHTALYYCPGSDLYGKTPKGKTARQRDAQLDQFEPATRKACD